MSVCVCVCVCVCVSLQVAFIIAGCTRATYYKTLSHSLGIDTVKCPYFYVHDPCHALHSSREYGSIYKYILPYSHTGIFSYSFIYSHIYMSAGLEVMQGFPCRCDLTSSTKGPATEREVRGRE